MSIRSFKKTIKTEKNILKEYPETSQKQMKNEKAERKDIPKNIEELLQANPNLMNKLSRKFSKNKKNLLPLLKKALLADLKSQIIAEINKELNQIENDFLLADYMELIEKMKKSYDFATAPTWALPLNHN